jgi:hypothetical protein
MDLGGLGTVDPTRSLLKKANFPVSVLVPSVLWGRPLKASFALPMGCQRAANALPMVWFLGLI